MKFFFLLFGGNGFYLRTEENLENQQNFKREKLEKQQKKISSSSNIGGTTIPLLVENP